LLLSGTNLYLGGQFTRIGNSTRQRLARLSTASGAALASWIPAVDSAMTNVSSNSYISSLVLNGTDLFVSGTFTTVGTSNRSHLAKLGPTGSGAVDAWNPQPTASSGDFALAVSGNNLFVGGQFTRIGNQNLANLARLSLTAPANADTNWVASMNTAPV